MHRIYPAKHRAAANARRAGAQLVRLVGIPIVFEIERAVDHKRIDHVWLDVKAGDEGLFRISLNTLSLKSLQSGFDPRIRVAIVPSQWTEIPALGIFPSQGLNYDHMTTADVDFCEYEQAELEELIGSKFRAASVVEAWGEVYLHGQPGIHQVHSRRASAVIRTDHVGRDGAVRFYYEDGMKSELLLFKFFGQP